LRWLAIFAGKSIHSEACSPCFHEVKLLRGA
ncbi:MAG: hypothetical protein ACJA01_002427, partial [Saprospiraceae bacterium]